MIEKLDIHDLSPEEAKLVQDFVEFLRRKQLRVRHAAEQTDEGWSGLAVPSFAEDWENDEDAIYDHWKEHYGV